jgi:hypothetical protein
MIRTSVLACIRGQGLACRYIAETGEYRVTYTERDIRARENITGYSRVRDRAEALACYTDDPDDALMTARAMAQAWGIQPLAVQCQED